MSSSRRSRRPCGAAAGRPDPPPPHDDRNKVAEVLRQAAGEGRIDLEELDERLEAAYRAKTYGELVPITADLPVAPLLHPVPAPPARRVPTGPLYTSSVAVMSESRREGGWLVP